MKQVQHQKHREPQQQQQQQQQQKKKQPKKPLSQVASALKGVEFIAQHIKKADRDTEVMNFCVVALLGRENFEAYCRPPHAGSFISEGTNVV